MSPVFLPPRFKRSKRCARCGHWYAPKADNCTHCYELTDAQAQQLQQQLAARKQADQSLGGLFLFIAVMMVIAVVLAVVLT